MDINTGLRPENESIDKIYYLFSFLMIWYGIAWYTFPMILGNVSALEEESGLIFSATFSFSMLSICVILGVVLFLLGLSEKSKR